MLGNLSCFLSSVDSYKINFFGKKIRECHKSVKQNVGPDLDQGLSVEIESLCLDPNCLQRLSADDTCSKELTKVFTTGWSW